MRPDPSQRKPSWIKVRPPSGEAYLSIKKELRERSLYTVCEEARCPNVGECWGSGTATILCLGDTCTRKCGFCSVKTGNPQGWLDPLEPQKVSETIHLMNLKYVVLTTVDRDDLKDFGASQLANIIRTVRGSCPHPPLIEILTGDFRGNFDNLKILCDAKPNVFSHNIETVERLTSMVRDRRASFKQSLEILIKARHHGLLTKSSIMVGLGETLEEILKALQILKNSGVSVVTLGQYLQPTPKHLPVKRYVTPQEFEIYKNEGLKMGFDYVASGPLIRSSYKAGEHFLHQKLKENSDEYRI